MKCPNCESKQMIRDAGLAENGDQKKCDYCYHEWLMTASGAVTLKQGRSVDAVA